MTKIDRLGWAAGICFVSHGARIGIRVNEPSALDRIPEHLPPHWKPTSAPVVDAIYSLIVGGSANGGGVRRYHLLYSGAERVARTMDLDRVFETLESDLHFQVAVHARRRLFVHAGVVGWGGRAIVIPGRSHSGKSSLVAALVRAGATYLSDEYAVFDARGRVHPYPKPIAFKRNGAGFENVPVEALGGATGTRPLPVGVVAVTRYRPGTHWRPRRLTPGQGLLELLDNTVLARIRPRLALATLQQAVAGATSLKSKRGEADAVAGALLDRAGAEARRMQLSAS